VNDRILVRPFPFERLVRSASEAIHGGWLAEEWREPSAFGEIAARRTDEEVGRILRAVRR
jgi:hypothetical protein